MYTCNCHMWGKGSSLPHTCNDIQICEVKSNCIEHDRGLETHFSEKISTLKYLVKKFGFHYMVHFLNKLESPTVKDKLAFATVRGKCGNLNTQNALVTPHIPS